MSLKCKKAFSLVELLVALGLIVAMLAGSGFIFSVAVKSQRAASATGETMVKLRAITNQLNDDFGRIRKDMPMLVRFEQFADDLNGDGLKNENCRIDQVMFFATGDFRSHRQYLTTGDPMTVRGNIARIQYALSISGPAAAYSANVKAEGPIERFLTRRQHILTSDSDVANNIKVFPRNDNNFNTSMADDAIYEYDLFTVDDWKRVVAEDSVDSNKSIEKGVIPNCFDDFVDVYNAVDTSIAEPDKRYNLLLCEGVSNFKVQFGYYDDGSNKAWRWFPSDDPDYDLNNSDSHFGNSGDPLDSGGKDSFGALINVNNSKSKYGVVFQDGSNADWLNLAYDVPRAFKFTFTIHDKANELGGKTFTHIVYVED